MNLSAIYHRTTDKYAYQLSDTELIINIETGYDVDHVYIYQGDPYLAGIMGGKEAWQGRREEICYKKRKKEHIWWTTTLFPEYKRCKYYFEIVSGDEKIFLFEDGFYTEEEMYRPGKMLSYFIYPWMNPVDTFKTPDWVNDTVWYQIFPERFCNGDSSNDNPGTKPWKCEKIHGHNDYYGGDLQGIIDRFDHIKNLGITGIYLNPVFEAESNHKYNTTNYKKVDPHFGTNEKLRELVDLAHKNGVRVMLDAVFNHTGTDISMWQDILTNGKMSKYKDWYMINEWPVDKKGDTKDGRYYSFAFAQYMPKLNTNNPEVREYLLDIVEFWMKEFDIDGLRFDVGNEISHRFLQEVRTLTKSIKPDFYLLGEIWHDATPWLLGNEYDAVMNYPLSTAISNYWIYPEWDSSEFEYGVNRSFTMYMQQANDVMFNLLDSHDTNRLIDKVGDKDVFYQQLAVLYTMPGSPCIYYGTEIVMPGGHDPDCRRCMPWDEIDAGVYDEEINEIRQLIRLRKEHPAARSRNFHFPNSINDKRTVEYIKLCDEGCISIVLNCGEEAVEIPPEITYKNVLYSRKYQAGVLEPKGILISLLEYKNYRGNVG
ncbi:MAG: alpha amylase N-terminal ig-like domain-containing protein [Eubacterium sp.]|nr:alpha amylase N-terminal ig-like domain-containing protein [Eubacterium sp.]